MSFDHLNNGLYKDLYKSFSRLSGLFSDSSQPYIPYRFAERAFIKAVKEAYDPDDLSRHDNSFDATVTLPDGKVAGVGIKTFIKTGTPYKDEKVAEFSPVDGVKTDAFKRLTREEMVTFVASLRNKRIMSDAQEYGIDIKSSFYHCVVRDNGKIFFHEEPYPLIDLSKLKVTGNSSNDNMIYFTDGVNEYKYSQSKSVIFKRFKFTEGVNSPDLPVDISADPFSMLLSGSGGYQNSNLNIILNSQPNAPSRPFVILPLYSTRGRVKNVPEASGLNQWNAGGRAREFGESYFPIPIDVRRNNPGFFPSRDERFDLHLPDGTTVPASICQDGGKALMSKPNVLLASWVYRVIDGSLSAARQRMGSVNRPYTYDDLVQIGKDSVVVFKNNDGSYSVNFMPVGTYDIYKENGFCAENFEEFRDQCAKAKDVT